MFRCSAVLWTWMLAASVGASDLDVSWSAPAQDCPDREQLRAGLSRRLQRDVSFGPDAALRLAGVITKEETGYALWLTTRSPQGTEQRSMRAQGCNELAHASVLIAALLFTEPQPEPAPEPLPALEPQPAARPEPAQQQPSERAGASRSAEPVPLDWYVRAQLVGDLGTLPALSLGPGIMVGLGLGDFLIEAGGMYLVGQDVSVAGRSSPVGALQLTTAAAGVCYRLLRKPLLAPCLRAELGSLSASGRDLRDNRDSSLMWSMAGAGLRFGLDLAGWLRWHTEVGAGLPWDRAQFAVEQLGPVYRISGVIGRFTTGVEGVF